MSFEFRWVTPGGIRCLVAQSCAARDYRNDLAVGHHMVDAWTSLRLMGKSDVVLKQGVNLEPE